MIVSMLKKRTAPFRGFGDGTTDLEGGPAYPAAAYGPQQPEGSTTDNGVTTVPDDGNSPPQQVGAAPVVQKSYLVKSS